MCKKITKEEFIEKTRQVHGNKYDYSKVNYINNRTKVRITCPEHGEFWQTPHSHLSGCGCPECGKKIKSEKKKLTTEEFIKKAKEIHGDKYDYSKVEYKNCGVKVCIICPEHGEFRQKPYEHLSGCGCPECGKKIKSEKKKLTTEEFILKAKKVHGDKYDYSKVEYVNALTPVCIICSEHGEFWQKPSTHLSGNGCRECRKEFLHNKFKSSTEEFILKAREIHGNKYDYSKVEYVNALTPVCIICPKHGEFWQKPNVHLSDSGCKICSESHLEKEVYNYLKKNNIKFETQKTFEWLKYKINMYLDFYLPDYNIAIECQGAQHFIPVSFGKEFDFDKDKNFIKIKERDKKKKQLCDRHNIKIYYYINNNYFYEKEIYTEKYIFKNLENLKKILNDTHI